MRGVKMAEFLFYCPVAFPAPSVPDFVEPSRSPLDSTLNGTCSASYDGQATLFGADCRAFAGTGCGTIDRTGRGANRTAHVPTSGLGKGSGAEQTGADTQYQDTFFMLLSKMSGYRPQVLFISAIRRSIIVLY